MARKGFFLLAAVAFLAGCGLSPEARVEREKALKGALEDFIRYSTQKDWNGIYGMSAGKFADWEKLKDHMTQPWNKDSRLTGGAIASMAWVNDGLAKVKINWSFQSGSVQSVSSETFVWVWKGGAWKYHGRTLR